MPKDVGYTILQNDFVNNMGRCHDRNPNNPMGSGEKRQRVMDAVFDEKGDLPGDPSCYPIDVSAKGKGTAKGPNAP